MEIKDMGKFFNFKSKDEVIQYIHQVKKRKLEREAAAKAEYRAMQEETENLRRELYATLES